MTTMSAESSDCEQISEWTIVDSNGDDEHPGNDLSAKGSTFGDEARSEEGSGETQAGEMPDLTKENVVDLSPKNPSKEGSEASDIERISDDGMDCLNYSMEGSVISHMSTFSLINTPECRDADTESLSGSSGISVIQEDDVRPTNYTHTPNRKLNFMLNLLLVLSVTMVVGLGIGHFIGWSSRWMHARQLHQTHIAKLKALQEELADCLQNPSSYYLETNGESKACYEKVDYWKKKFEDMLSENRVLQEFVVRTMNKDALDNDDDEKCEEAHRNIVAEYRELKFHLIMQQLENVATLRQVEALKHQEMETLYRVKQLEEENQELKAQVEEDLNEDAAREAEEKAAIALLAAENQELKQELNKLSETLKLEQEQVGKKTVEELWPLREQINQLQVENLDLKHVIAKLRYSQPPPEELRAKPEKAAPPAPKSRFANREPPQKPDNYLHSWLVDNMKELNLTEFIEYLTRVAMDKEAARRELMHLEENLKLSYEQLSEKAKHGIDTGKTLLSDLQKNLHSKLQQIMNVDPADVALPIEHIQKVGKTLKKTVVKMYEIGMDMLNTKQEDGSESEGNHKFQKQVDKLMAKFGNQWENIKSSVWGPKDAEGGVDDEDAGKEKSVEKTNDDIFVAARREDHDKDQGLAHEERAEMYAKGKNKKREKNKEKKTAIRNDEDKLSKMEEQNPIEESDKTVKQNKDKKNKNKDNEKYRKNYNKRVSDDESTETAQGAKKSNKRKGKDIPENDRDESSDEKKLKKEKKSKTSKNDEKYEKSKKNHNKKVRENEKPQTDSKSEKKLKKRENSENPDANDNKEKNKDKSKQSKQKEKREGRREKDDETCPKSKKNKSKNRTIFENHRENQKNYKNASKSRVSKNKNRKQTTNNTKFSDEQSGDWMFQRAEERTTKRKSKHQTDWLFERAYDREHIRKEAQKAEWYFSKNKRNAEVSNDKSKISGDEKTATKSNKKTNKMRKNQKESETEESSEEEQEEFTWNERRTRGHAYHYQYNVDWAMPDSRAYYSSCS